ncbi:MAG: iron-sulfur cluster repair di-iron protein [Flavobacterium sp.]|nr:iron-sulfur cluster repair di-iron protein [Flavobacterium sp.]
METLDKQTIGEYVAKDFRTAAVFSKHQIDFCCKGNITLEEVCQKKGLDIDVIKSEINLILDTLDDTAVDFYSWSLDLLVDYIEYQHHRYIVEKTATILQFLEKLCKVHGERHPELLEITDLFKSGGGSLAQHMKKEELILFPYIKKIGRAIRENAPIEQPNFGKIENPIAMMMDEHENEGERYNKISKLTDNYTPPKDACNTYKITFLMLQEFEQDLHKHIHLENNILFPKAKKLEEHFSAF